MRFGFLASVAILASSVQAADEPSYQTPFSISPSVESSVNKDGESKYFSLAPSIELSGVFKTSSGYDLNLGTSYGLSYNEYLDEDPVDSASDLRDFEHAVGVTAGFKPTDMVSTTFSAKAMFYRTNTFEQLSDNTNAYQLKTDMSVSGIPKTSFGAGVGFTAVDWMNTYVNAEPIGDGIASGSGAVESIGDRSVFTPSIFAEQACLPGGGEFGCADTIVPTVGTVLDMTFDGNVKGSYSLPQGVKVSGSYSIGHRSSDNPKREKWSNKVKLGASMAPWDGGSLAPSYGVAISNFDNVPADDTFYRRDIEHKIAADLSQTITDNFSTAAGYAFTNNDSNSATPGTSYTKHTVYLSLSASF